MQLQHNDEPDGDQDDGQIDENHQTTHAPRVRAERIWRRHSLHDDACLRRVVGQRGGRVAFGALRAHPLS